MFGLHTQGCRYQEGRLRIPKMDLVNEPSECEEEQYQELGLWSPPDPAFPPFAPFIGLQLYCIVSSSMFTVGLRSTQHMAS